VQELDRGMALVEPAEAGDEARVEVKGKDELDTEGFDVLLRRKIMPRGDGSGPMGQGPMTGRGAGTCAGYANPGYANAWGGGMGMAWGRGGPRGYARRGFVPGPGARWMGTPWVPAYGPMPYAAPNRETQAAALQSQAEQLRDMLQQIEEQIRALKEEE